MEIKLRNLLITLLAFIGLLGLTVGIAALALRLNNVDLLHLSLFLLVFGGVTMAFSIFAGRFGLPRWIHSIRGYLLLVSAIVVLFPADLLLHVGFDPLGV